jgi:sulfur carrier protein ThiS
MSVVVRPIGLLKAFCRDRLDELDRIVLADRDGSTLEAVCQDIGLPAGLVSLFIVNGHIQERSYRLQTGDDVKCVAIIGGG